MISKIRHTVLRMVRPAGVLLLSLSLSGCVYDSYPDENPEDDGPAVHVGFKIRVNDKYGTRSESDLPTDYDDKNLYEAGVGYENYISTGDMDFRFMMFDKDGRYVETMRVLTILPSGQGDFPAEYTVLCRLTSKIDGAFKVVALANWGNGNYPSEPDLTAGASTIGDVCKAGLYDYKAPFRPSEATPIPMYGIRTSSIELLPDVVNDLGDIYLLRAMAKVEVKCAEGSGLELSRVTLTGFNKSGYSAPSGMETNTAYVDTPHIPDGAVDGGELPFTVSDDGGTAVIYIPEYSNTAEGASPSRVQVTFADNTSKNYPVDFCSYKEGKPDVAARFDIKRNVCYRFTVDKKADFEVKVLPYGEVWLDPIFGLD